MTLKTKYFVLIALGLSMLGICPTKTVAATTRHDNAVWEVRIGKAVIAAEVVESRPKIYLGLSGREQLPAGTGMLFVMPTREVQHFCMRGMRLALDFIWIDGQRVIGVTPGIAASDPRTLSSPGPATHVLELPAGYSARHSIKAGYRVQWRPWPAGEAAGVSAPVNIR